MTGRPFPFGIPPESSDPSLDERGFDTVNRLLLHGARYHDRKSVFLSSELGDIPDWRADRLSIRIALALAEDHGVGPGDVVAVAMPFSIRFALVERAVWALGAATAGESVSRAVKAVVDADTGWNALLDRGGALDTPERATRLRALARTTPPDAIAAIEEDVSLRQRDWVDLIEAFLARHPPERGARNDLFALSDISNWHRPVPARAALYAGWADGRTTVVLTLAA